MIKTDRKNGGYTLIELTVVIVLIGLLMGITVPRFRYALLTDQLKGSTRKFIGIIKNLRSEAIRAQEDYTLHFDLETDRYWIESESMTEEKRTLVKQEAQTLPPGIRVQDVWYRDKGKKMTGESRIRFSRKGYVQPAVIHIGSEDDRAFTLVINPFLGRVKVLEGYVEVENT